MKPGRIRTPAPTPVSSRLQRQGSAPSETEEVSVYCRVRPIGGSEDPADERCVEVIDEKTIRLIPPESSKAFYTGKASEYAFKVVFDEDATQTEVFRECGKPLVKNLLQGKNGLLFTYGVTGSGKTYTMQGTLDNGGIMSKSIDVIFNSIEGRQTSRKYLIDSDKLNDFQIQSVADAMLQQQKETMNEMRSRNAYTPRSNNSSDPNLSNRLPDETKISSIDQNFVYAVFISYYEIYNKYIYDLLDDARDPVTGRPKFESKSLREDAHGNMFVYGCTEKEVRNPKEALELFFKGQKKRRVAQTQLNFESSRSHSIFNIRLVKCSPADELEIDPTKACLVSQLALVDLAGSERTSRTGNIGDRLREAGNINNSLMNLRACIEKLRENQRTGKSGNVPYRNDKLTHLFRNYFEGSGSVKMIVNVNPRASDFDETTNVLQFAELTQEIEIERFDPRLRDFAMTPSRHRAQQVYEEALQNPDTKVDVDKLNPNYDPIYSLGPPWPSLDWKGFDDEETLPALERFLEQRFATRNTLVDDIKQKQEEFRQKLVAMKQENILLQDEVKQLRAGRESDKRRIKDLENRLVNAEAANTSLQRRVEACMENKAALEQELDDKEIEFNQQKKDAKREVRRLRSQVSSERVSRGKRSFDEVDVEEEAHVVRGVVGSRIAEMEARTGGGKKIRK